VKLFFPSFEQRRKKGTRAKRREGWRGGGTQIRCSKADTSVAGTQTNRAQQNHHDRKNRNEHCTKLTPCCCYTSHTCTGRLLFTLVDPTRPPLADPFDPSHPAFFRVLCCTLFFSLLLSFCLQSFGGLQKRFKRKWCKGSKRKEREGKAAQQRLAPFCM